MLSLRSNLIVYTVAVSCLAVAGAGQSKPEAAAESAPGAEPTVLLGMVGTWEGELVYRDYQSDERVTLPAKRRAELSADGRFLLQEMAFTDPGHVVTSHQIVMLDDAGTISIVMMGRGGLVRETYEVRTMEVEDLLNAWTVVLERTGEDDRRPADIRLTHTLKGDVMTARKDVRYQDGDTWEFRNETRFERRDADVSALVGTWYVDMRAHPAADPHVVELRVDAVEDGRLTGSFYGSPIRDGFVNVKWGAVQFAFVTEDDSTAYSTSGAVEGQRLTGRTHAPQRSFLSVWRAHRGG